MYGFKRWYSNFDIFDSFESFLFERQQRVVLNRQESEWLIIKVGVPQDLALGTLLFLYIYIYINDLSDNLESNLKPFADDISMFSVVCDPINIPQ